MGRVTFGISPECLCHDVRDNVRRVADLEQAGFDYIWEGGLLIPEAYSYIQDRRVIEQRALLMKDEPVQQAFCVASSGGEIIERFEAFIEAGCNHILRADMSPDPSLVAKVCADEVLPYQSERCRGKVPQPV